MNASSALCLLAVVGCAAAGLINPRQSSECSPTCKETSKFSYRPGTVYEYRYSGNVATKLAGISNQQSGLYVTASVQITFISKCETTLKLTGVQLLETDAQTGRRTPSPGTDAFAQALEQRPVKFSFQDGVIESVCAPETEPEWVTNIKRAILSAFQNSMTNFDDQTETVDETDIAGKCPATYRIGSSSWGRSFTVTKTKNLMACSNRDGFRTALQATPYRVASDIQSLPLLKSTHECEQTIHNSGYLLKTSCIEEHVFRPFSRGDSGAKTDASQILEFVSESSAQPRQMTDRTRRTDLLFRNEDINQRQDVRATVAVLEEIARQPEDVRPETPKLFSDLVYRMKGLDISALTTIHNKVKANTLVQANHEKAKKFFYDALAMTGTSGSVTLMTRLIKNGEITGAEKEMWLSTLAFVQKPTRAMVVAVKELMAPNAATRTSYLSASALVNNYCRQNKNCQTDTAIRQITNVLINVHPRDCRVRNENEREKVLYSLKALANMGDAADASAALTTCAAQAANPTEIRVAAFEALRNQPCGANRAIAMTTFADPNEDSEVRIAAYLATIKCATRETFEQIRQILELDEVNQVGSFVWTHLTNLMETSAPLKQEIRAILENQSLKKAFDLDKRKFSRNLEGSVFFDSINMGAQAESNLIWSQKSFVPRSAMLNLTIDLFGNSVNLLEVGGRVEGLETMLEKFFGPKGYFPDNAISRTVRRTQKSFNENLMAEKERQHRAATGPNDLKGSAYLKVFGNELAYGELRDLIAAENINILDVLIKLAQNHDYDYSKSVMFMDSTVIVPTVLGLPLKLSVNGSATINVKVNGKVDLRQLAAAPRSMDIDGYIKPSSAVEIASVMGVDAFVTRSGLKMITTLHSSTEVNGKLSLQNGRVFLANLNLPKEKTEIMSVKNSLFVIHNNVDVPTVNAVGTENSKRMCTGEGLAKVTGVEFCGEVGYVNTFGNTETPLFPFNGNAKASVVMNKVDTHTGYMMEARMEKVRTRTNGRVQTSYISRLAFNTPKSTVDREISIDFRLRPSQNHLSFELVSPWKRASLNGIIQNEVNMKKAELMLTVDREHRYGFTSQVIVGRKEGRITFSPRAELHMAGRKPVVLDGSLDITQGRKIDVDMALRNAAATPLTLKGTIDKDLRRGRRFNADVEMKTPWLSSKFTGYVEKKLDTYKSRMAFDYNLAENPVPHKVVVNYKVRNAKSASMRTISANFGFLSTQFPTYDFQATWEAQNAAKHTESSLKINYGDSRTQQHLVSTGIILKSDKQPDGSLKCEGSARFLASQWSLNSDMKVEHRQSPRYFHTKMNVNASPSKTMTAEVNLQDLTRDLMHMTGEATLMLPGKSYTMSHQIEERQRREYHHNMFTQWGVGKQIQTTTVLKKVDDTYSLKFTGKVPNYAPLSLSFNTRLNPWTFRTDLDLSYNRRKYSANVDYALNVEGAHFSFAGNADLTCPYRHVIASVRTNRLGPEVRLEFNTQWDADRDRTKQVAFVGFYRITEDRRSRMHEGTIQVNYLGKVHEVVVTTKKTEQNYLSTLGVTSGEQFLNMKTTIDYNNGVAGKMTVKSSCPKMRDVTARLTHSGSWRSFDTDAEATWGVDKKVGFTITSRIPNLAKADIRVSMRTPCPVNPEIIIHLKHALETNALTTGLTANLGDHTIVALVTGSVEERLLNTRIKLTTPWTNPIIGVFSYEFTETAASMKFNAEAAGKQIAAILVLKPEWQNFNAKFQIITPFEQFNKVGIELGNVISGDEISAVVNVEFNERKAGIDLIGRIKADLSNVEVTAKVSIPIVGYNDLGLSVKYEPGSSNFLVETNLAWTKDQRYALTLFVDNANPGACSGKLVFDIPMRKAISYEWNHQYHPFNLKSIHTATVNDQRYKLILDGELSKSPMLNLKSRISTITPVKGWNVVVTNNMEVENGKAEMKSAMIQGNLVLYNTDLEFSASSITDVNLEITFNSVLTAPIKATVTTQTKQFPYSTRVEALYGEKRIVADVMCKHLSYKNFEYAVRFQTPCPHMRNGEVKFTNTVANGQVNSAVMITRNSKTYEVAITGAAQIMAAQNDISGKVTIKMPDREPTIISMKHTRDMNQCTTTMEATCNGRRQASATVSGDYQWRGSYLRTRGSVSLTTPFEGYNSMTYKWQHSQDGTMYVSKHNAMLNEKSATFNVEGSLRNENSGMVLTAKSVVELPIESVGRLDISATCTCGSGQTNAALTVKQNERLLLETSLTRSATLNMVESAIRVAIAERAPISATVKITKQVPYTVHIEASWEADKQMTVNARCAHFNINNVDMSLNIATPFNGFERISASMSQMYQEGQFRHNSIVEYKPLKRITIEALWESFPLRRTLTISTPCRYIRNLIFNVERSKARLEYTGIENVKAEAELAWPKANFQLTSTIPKLRNLQALAEYENEGILVKIQRDPEELLYIQGSVRENPTLTMRSPCPHMREFHFSATPQLIALTVRGYSNHRLMLSIPTNDANHLAMNLEVDMFNERVCKADLTVRNSPETFNFAFEAAQPFYAKTTVDVDISRGFKILIDSKCPCGHFVTNADLTNFIGEATLSAQDKRGNTMSGQLEYNTNAQDVRMIFSSTRDYMRSATLTLKNGQLVAKFQGRHELDFNGQISDLSANRINGNVVMTSTIPGLERVETRVNVRFENYEEGTIQFNFKLPSTTASFDASYNIPQKEITVSFDSPYTAAQSYSAKVRGNTLDLTKDQETVSITVNVPTFDLDPEGRTQARTVRANVKIATPWYDDVESSVYMWLHDSLVEGRSEFSVSQSGKRVTVSGNYNLRQGRLSFGLSTPLQALKTLDIRVTEDSARFMIDGLERATVTVNVLALNFEEVSMKTEIRTSFEYLKQLEAAIKMKRTSLLAGSVELALDHDSRVTRLVASYDVLALESSLKFYSPCKYVRHVTLDVSPRMIDFGFEGVQTIKVTADLKQFSLNTFEGVIKTTSTISQLNGHELKAYMSHDKLLKGRVTFTRKTGSEVASLIGQYDIKKPELIVKFENNQYQHPLFTLTVQARSIDLRLNENDHITISGDLDELSLIKTKGRVSISTTIDGYESFEGVVESTWSNGILVQRLHIGPTPTRGLTITNELDFTATKKWEFKIKTPFGGLQRFEIKTDLSHLSFSIMARSNGATASLEAGIDEFSLRTARGHLNINTPFDRFSLITARISHNVHPERRHANAEATLKVNDDEHKFAMEMRPYNLKLETPFEILKHAELTFESSRSPAYPTVVRFNVLSDIVPMQVEVKRHYDGPYTNHITLSASLPIQCLRTVNMVLTDGYSQRNGYLATFEARLPSGKSEIRLMARSPSDFEFDLRSPYQPLKTLRLKVAHDGEVLNYFQNKIEFEYVAYIVRIKFSNDLNVRGLSEITSATRITTPVLYFEMINMDLDHKYLNGEYVTKFDIEYEPREFIRMQSNIKKGDVTMTIESPLRSLRNVRLNLNRRRDRSERSVSASFNYNDDTDISAKINMPSFNEMSVAMNARSPCLSYPYSLTFSHTRLPGTLQEAAVITYGAKEIKASISATFGAETKTVVKLETPCQFIRKYESTTTIKSVSNVLTFVDNSLYEGLGSTIRTNVDVKYSYDLRKVLARFALDKDGGEHEIMFNNEIEWNRSCVTTFHTRTPTASVHVRNEALLENEEFNMDFQLTNNFPGIKKLNLKIKHNDFGFLFKNKVNTEFESDVIGDFKYEQYLETKDFPDVAGYIELTTTKCPIFSNVRLAASHRVGGDDQILTLAGAWKDREASMVAKYRVEPDLNIDVEVKTPIECCREMKFAFGLTGDKNNFQVRSMVRHTLLNLPIEVEMDHSYGESLNTRLSLKSPYHEPLAVEVLHHSAEAAKKTAQLSVTLGPSKASVVGDVTFVSLKNFNGQLTYQAMDQSNYELTFNHKATDSEYRSNVQLQHGQDKLVSLTMNYTPRRTQRIEFKTLINVPLYEQIDASLTATKTGDTRTYRATCSYGEYRGAWKSQFEFRNLQDFALVMELEQPTEYKTSVTFTNKCSSPEVTTNIKLESAFFEGPAEALISYVKNPKLGKLTLKIPSLEVITAEARYKKEGTKHEASQMVSMGSSKLYEVVGEVTYVDLNKFDSEVKINIPCINVDATAVLRHEMTEDSIKDFASVRVDGYGLYSAEIEGPLNLESMTVNIRTPEAGRFVATLRRTQESSTLKVLKGSEERFFMTVKHMIESLEKFELELEVRSSCRFANGVLGIRHNGNTQKGNTEVWARGLGETATLTMAHEFTREPFLMKDDITFVSSLTENIKFNALASASEHTIKVEGSHGEYKSDFESKMVNNFPAEFKVNANVNLPHRLLEDVKFSIHHGGSLTEFCNVITYESRSCGDYKLTTTIGKELVEVDLETPREGFEKQAFRAEYGIADDILSGKIEGLFRKKIYRLVSTVRNQANAKEFTTRITTPIEGFTDIVGSARLANAKVLTVKGNVEKKFVIFVADYQKAPQYRLALDLKTSCPRIEDTNLMVSFAHHENLITSGMALAYGEDVGEFNFAINYEQENAPEFRITLKTPYEGYTFSELSGAYRIRSDTSIKADLLAKMEGKAIATDVEFKLSPFDTKLTLRTPFEGFQNQMMHVQFKGNENRFNTEVAVTAMEKEGKASLSFTNQNLRRIVVNAKLQTPFDGIENWALSLIHTGDTQNLRTQFNVQEANRRICEAELTHSPRGGIFRIQSTALNVKIEHNGPWDNCNTVIAASWKGQRFNMDQTFRRDPLKAELKVMVPGIIDMHATKQGYIRDHKSRANVKYYGREYQLLTEMEAQNALRSSVLLTTPHSALSHCHIKISHDGGMDMNRMRSKITWLHNQNKVFEIAHQRHNRGGNLRVNVARNTVTIIQNGNWDDCTTNFEINLANGLKVIGDQKFSLDPLNVMLTVRVPGKMNVELSHTGYFPNFKSTASAAYGSHAIRSEVQLMVIPGRGFKGSAALQTPYENFRDMKMVLNYEAGLREYQGNGIVQWTPTDKITGSMDMNINGRNVRSEMKIVTPFMETMTVKVTHDDNQMKSGLQASYGQREMQMEMFCDKNAGGYITAKSPFPYFEDVALHVRKIRISNNNGYQVKLQIDPRREITADVSAQIFTSPKTVYLKLTTPFPGVANMILNGEHQFTNGMVKQKLTVVLNSQSIWESSVDARVNDQSINTEVVLNSPRAMKYTLQVQNEEKLKKMELNLDWDTTTRGSDVYLIAEAKDQSAYYRTKKEASIRLTIPSRTVYASQVYEHSRLKTNHIFEASWAQNQKIKLHLGHQDESRSYRNAYTLFTLLETPIRTMKTSYKHMTTDKKYEGTWQTQWDAERNPAKMMEMAIAYDLNSNVHSTTVTLRHPVLSQPIVIRNDIETAANKIQYTGTITFSDDQDEQVVVVGQIKDETRGRRENITSSLSLTHKKTASYYALEGHMANTPTAASVGVSASYRNSRRQTQNKASLFGEIQKLRKSINIEARTTNRLAAFSGSVQKTPIGFDGHFTNTLNNRVMESELSVNTQNPTFAFKSIDSATPRVTYHASGSLSKKNLHMQAYRLNNGFRVTDGEISVRLNNSRVLRTALKWRPEDAREIQAALQEYMNKVRANMEVSLNTASTTIYEELASRVEVYRQAMNIFTPLVEYVDVELESFRRDYERMNAELDRMYERNEFYAKDIHTKSIEAINYIKERTARLQYRLRTKFADVRRSIHTRLSGIRRALDEQAGLIQDTIAGFVLKFRPAWQSYAYAAIRQAQIANMVINHQGEMAFEKLGQYKDGLVNYLDDKFDHITYKVEYYVDKLIGLQESTRFYLLSEKQKTYLDNISEKVAEFWQRFQMEAARLRNTVIEKADTVLDSLEAAAMRKMEEVFGREYTVLLGEMADKIVEEIKQTYEQWDIDEDLRRLAIHTIENLAAQLRQQARVAAQRYFRIGRTGFTVFDPENGHIEADVFLPLELESLDTMPKIDFEAWKKELQSIKEKYMPKRPPSILDLYYRYKPTSDIANWIPPFKAHASVFLGKNFITFDGRHYQFAGSCSYVLAKVFDEPEFSIVANYKRGLLESYSIVSDGREILMTVNPSFYIKLDQNDVELPIAYQNTRVTRDHNIVRVNNRFGMNFECDLNHERCTMELSGWYFNKVGGLFGTYDNEQYDDFSTPSLERGNLQRFTESWQVGNNCAVSRNLYRPEAPTVYTDTTCKEMFDDDNSPLRKCFGVLKPDTMFKICEKTTGDRGSVCSVAAMYVKACEVLGVEMDMPKKCSDCGHYPESHELIASNTPASQSADVVFVVEEMPCTRNIVSKLGTMAMSIKRELRSRGLRDNRFGLVGYGGSIEDFWPHTHTIKNRLFGSAELMRVAATNMQIDDFQVIPGMYSDAYRAIKYAAQYPFRVGVSKNIILLQCTSCDRSKGSQGSIQKFLQDRDITLHVLQPEGFANPTVFGIDRTTAYTARDAMTTTLNGNADLFRQTRVPKQSCASLALSAGGSSFTATRMNSVARDERQLTELVARRVADSARPTERQTCSCVTGPNRISQTVCEAAPVSQTRLTLTTPVQRLGRRGENPTMEGYVRPIQRPQQVSFLS